MSLKIDLEYDRVCGLIDDLIDSIDFTMPGPTGASLAEDITTTIATGIAERSNQGLDPSGQPFRSNEPRYARYKANRYDVDHPGELSGQTFSLTSLVGEVTITPRQITMVHGVDATPGGTARNGTPLHPSEAHLTDRQKGVLLTEGGRPFYEVDENIVKAVGDIAAEALVGFIRDRDF